jgi:hypothetical protein
MTKISKKLASGLLCTYGTTNQGNDSFQVLLPNGRNVELCSKEGCDKFVDSVGTDFISTNLTGTDDQELTFAYALIEVVRNASPEKIASGIPESEILTFIEHMRDTLDTLSTDRKWLRSGTVSMGHEMLLDIVASFAKHPSFLKIFISNEGMEAFAKFYASRKMNDTPNHKVSELIVLLVNNSYCYLPQEGLSQEKGLRTIEKTGLLGEFIRCVPVDPEGSAQVMACLQLCLQLVKKKLKSGTPTGDILDAVIAGKHGPINKKAKSSLARLQTLARLSNDNDDSDNKRTNLKMCQHCDKTETQMDSALLMKCQQCKETYYCSKDCQVADWKSHKKTCNELSLVSRSTRKAADTTIWAFIKSNYFDIAKEVYKKTQEYNVPKKELLVEIDFFGDAPALRNEFQVWLASGFLGGSTVTDAPDWFRTHSHSKDIKRYATEQYEQVTSDDLRVVCRAGNGLLNTQCLHFSIANTGHELLSDEAMESIGREDYVRTVACLGQHTADEYFREKKTGLK